MTQDPNSFFSRIRRSVFTDVVYPQAGSERKRSVFDNLILHIHPRTAPGKTLKFTLTWGLGGMPLVLVMLLALTGILLLFVYEPSSDKAYASILILQRDVPFGQFIRNIHHWSGNILVILSFLHLLRVYFTGAFYNARQFNWVIGVFLFFLVIFSNFTGYLLPWDQLAFWAITICTGMLEYMPGMGLWLQKMIRGGSEIGPPTLSIFFALHIAVLPILLFAVMPFHFWRVRKAGGVVIPRGIGEQLEEKGGFVPTIPNLVLREGVVTLVLIAFVLLYAILFNAPLEEQANPGMSPNPAKAPWYFLGVQELLLHFHPLFAVFVIPLLATLLCFLLPYFKYESPMPGVWFYSAKGRRMGVVAALTALVVTPFMIVADEYVINFSEWMPGIPQVISNGLVPVSILLILLTVFFVWIKRKYAATKDETIQALFIFLLVAFFVLTVTGIWFRGEGMGLGM
jgi:quinol-cytochrome oxidoreductase complex cytochrome b subunit